MMMMMCFVYCILYIQDVGRGCDQESTAADRRHKINETLVLYDQCSRSVADDVTVSTSQMTSYHVVSVLLRRLKQDGFRVYLLDGMNRNRVSLRLCIYCSIYL